MKKLLFLSLIVSNILLAQVTDQNGKRAVDSLGNDLIGNIGIGTHIPSEKLHVVGKAIFENENPVIQFRDNTGSTNYSDLIYADNKFHYRWGNGIKHTFENNSYVIGDYLGGENEVEISRAGNTWFNGGNIGIGTTTPSSILDINTINYGNNQEGGINLSAFYNNINYWTTQVGLKSNSGGGPRFAITTKQRNASNVETVNNEALSIPLYSGYVGIGTTSPAAKLDVEGGNFYLGEEVSSNGQRREFRVYGYDNSNKFYGSLHSNYDDNKRSFDISTNDQTSQIKIDASANSSANIILNPGVSGSVGIGTTTPDSKLTVAGKIHAREVKVTIDAGADFVFNADYKLRPLEEVSQFIKEHKHLPEIASEKEMQENGLHLAEMNIKLLQKIEELTLYTINQEKRIETIEAKNEKLITLVEQLLDSKIEK